MKKFLICLSLFLSTVSYTAIADDDILFVQNDSGSEIQQNQVSHQVPKVNQGQQQMVSAISSNDSSNNNDGNEVQPVELPTVVVTAKSNCHRVALYPGITVDKVVGSNEDTTNHNMQPMGVFAHDADGHQIMIMGASFTADGQQMWYEVRCTHPQKN